MSLRACCLLGLGAYLVLLVTFHQVLFRSTPIVLILIIGVLACLVGLFVPIFLPREKGRVVNNPCTIRRERKSKMKLPTMQFVQIIFYVIGVLTLLLAGYPGNKPPLPALFIGVVFCVSGLLVKPKALKWFLSSFVSLLFPLGVFLLVAGNFINISEELGGLFAIVGFLCCMIAFMAFLERIKQRQ